MIKAGFVPYFRKNRSDFQWKENFWGDYVSKFRVGASSFHLHIPLPAWTTWSFCSFSCPVHMVERAMDDSSLLVLCVLGGEKRKALRTAWPTSVFCCLVCGSKLPLGFRELCLQELGCNLVHEMLQAVPTEFKLDLWCVNETFACYLKPFRKAEGV